MVRAAKLLLSTAIVGVAAGVLVASSLEEADYFKHVHEVTLEPDRWRDRTLKVHGLVEAGSIDERIVPARIKRTWFGAAWRCVANAVGSSGVECRALAVTRPRRVLAASSRSTSTALAS